MSTPSPQEPVSPGSAREAAGAPPASEQERLAAHDIERLLAPNPGALTLSGTNTWLIGRSPSWLIDPGPRLEEHLGRIFAAVEQRGGLGGVVLTHDHHDHADALGAVRERYPAAPLAAGRGEVEVTLLDGVRFGPLEAVATPGHAADHFALIGGGACFTGDAVLGEGSVFIAPDSGAMAGYLRALTRLLMRSDFSVLCPGHGPPVWEAQAKLEEYLGHRIDRENRLVAALGEGRRTVSELLAAVWPEVPEILHPLAAVTLAAHLDKLAEEQILPAGVERPDYESTKW